MKKLTKKQYQKEAEDLRDDCLRKLTHHFSKAFIDYANGIWKINEKYGK